MKSKGRKTVKRGGALVTRDYPDGKYEGNIDDNGKRHTIVQKGTMTYNNGDVYVGHWKNDMKEGRGTMIYANDVGTYSGGWRNDKMDTSPAIQGAYERFATMLHSNGVIEQGYWLNGHLVRLRNAQPAVDVMQVHKAAANIDYDSLNDFLREHINPESFVSPALGAAAAYIDSSLKSLIETLPPSEERLKNLESIMENRLRGANYTEVSPHLLFAMFYSLEYTKLQTPSFIENYIDSFLNDTCIAYGSDTSIANMSCLNGARERLVLSLLPATTAASTHDANEEQTKEYKQLSEIIKNNPKTRTPELIIEWKKLYFDGVGLENILPPERKQMLIKYITDRVNPGNKPEINDIIIGFTEYADVEDKNDFDYKGGTKRRRLVKTQTKKRKSRKLNRKRGRK